MTGSARSVFVFDIYMLGEGALMMLKPDWLLTPFGCLAVLGTYYVQAARTERTEFFRISSFVRLAQVGFFGGLVLRRGLFDHDDLLRRSPFDQTCGCHDDHHHGPSS